MKKNVAYLLIVLFLCTLGMMGCSQSYESATNKARVRDLEARNGKLEEDYQSSVAECVQLRKKLNAALEANAQWKTDHTNLSNQNTQLTKEHGLIVAQFNKLKAIHGSLSDEHTQLTDEFTLLNKDHVKLVEAFNLFQQKHAMLEKHCRELTQVKKELQVQYTKLIQEQDQLKQLYAQMMQERDLLTQQYAQLKQTQSSTMQERVRVQKQFDALKAEYLAHHKKYKSDVARLTKERDDLFERNNHFIGERDALKAQMASLGRDLQNWLGRIEEVSNDAGARKLNVTPVSQKEEKEKK